MPLPSGFEWIVILVIALLILGPGKLPDVASAVGKSIREFRKASTDVQDAVRLDTPPTAAQSATPPAAPGNAPAEAAPVAPASTPPPSAAPSPAEQTSNPNR